MQPVLIYDIQSENMTQISQEHNQPLHSYAHQLKDTQTTAKTTTKVIQIRSQESQHSQASHPLAKQQKLESNIVFLEESMDSGTGYNEGTTRKLMEEQGQFEWQYEQQQQHEVKVQQVEEQRKMVILKQKRMLVRQQGLVMKGLGVQKGQENKMFVLKANTDLFIRQIIPKDFKLTCYLTIERNAIGLQSKYRLYLAEERQFLLTAKKQAFKYYSNYIISKHPLQINRRSQHYIGHIHANFIGTDFQLYAVRGDLRSLSLKAQYKKNLAGFNGPRSFRVIKSHPNNGKHHNLLNLMERKDNSKLICLSTLEPSIKKGKYRLDFGGKAKIASSKNFILAREEEKEWRDCLMFGKVKQSQFLMEISYPLSLFQAFGICLSSLDSKLLVS